MRNNNLIFFQFYPFMHTINASLKQITCYIKKLFSSYFKTESEL